MTIQLLTTLGPRTVGSTGLSRGSRETIARSFASSGGRLLRVWDAPVELRVPAAHFLVVRDPPALGTTASLLADERLRLEGVIPIVRLDAGADAGADLDAIGHELPSEFPQELLRDGLIAPGYSDVAILGLAFCTVCGGWGKHNWPH